MCSRCAVSHPLSELKNVQVLFSLSFAVAMATSVQCLQFLPQTSLSVSSLQAIFWIEVQILSTARGRSIFFHLVMFQAHFYSSALGLPWHCSVYSSASEDVIWSHLGKKKIKYGKRKRKWLLSDQRSRPSSQQQLKRKVDDCQVKLSQAKSEYRMALRNLESISDEIHARRRLAAMGPRGCGVGAEKDVGAGDDISNFKMESDGISSECAKISMGKRALFVYESPVIPKRDPGPMFRLWCRCVCVCVRVYCSDIWDLWGGKL